MAEVWFEKLAPNRIYVTSAGTEPEGFIHPLAIEVMNEVGIELKGRQSKSVNRFLQEEFKTLITVCDEADKSCPTIPGVEQRLHWHFEDPAKARGTESEKLAVFRAVRDEIETRVSNYLTLLPTS
jgi:arsenate reductase